MSSTFCTNMLSANESLSVPTTLKLCLMTEIRRETQMDKILRIIEASAKLNRTSESNFTVWKKKKEKEKWWKLYPYGQDTCYILLILWFVSDSKISTIIFNLHYSPISNSSAYVICLGKLFYHIAPSYPHVPFTFKKVIYTFNITGSKPSFIFSSFTEERKENLLNKTKISSDLIF